jgi:predicted nucleic acid-binding Zn ribbon protein
MSFQSLPHLLNAVTHQENWRGRQQFQQLVACWFEVVGAVVAAQTRPVGIQRKVLQVATSSSVWAQNLAFERHRILDKLNTRLELGLTDIRFSSAQWQSDFYRNGVENSSETVILWREHPSRVSHSPSVLATSLPIARDPQTAFRNWARTVRAQTQHLPLCPSCHCPTPEGELRRWAVCGLCAAQQFGQSLGQPSGQPLSKPEQRHKPEQNNGSAPPPHRS